MNRIYSLVFNRALGQLQVASELGGRSHGGAGHSTRGPRPALTCLALSLALAWLPAGAQAQAAPAPGQLPTGPNVIQGANAPTIDGLRMTIEQTDARALIRWDSFDIGADAAVHFQQGLGQAVLNQIGGGDASQIFGQLTGDGRVFLINPNGIVFGAEAQVNVGSLVASGLAMTTSEQDFLGGADELHFAAGGAGVVVNRGDIRGTDASGQGNVALLGRAVHNEGDIGGTLTMIDLVAADAATLSAGGVYEFTPTAAVAGAGAALVTNSGTLESQGGRITLAASADPFGGVLINSSGIISAAGFVEGESGAVRLRAAGGGIEVSGTVTATGNTLTIDAGRDAVALTNSENRLDGARVNVTAGATEIATQGDLNLYMVDTLDLTVNSGGALNLGRGTIGGVVNARSGGPITRSFEAPLTLGRSGALSTLDAGGHDILLADERGGTLFMGNFDVTGADVYLESTGAMMLNRISTDSLYAIGTHGVMLGTGTVDGSLTVHSYGGVVGQVGGGLTVAGPTAITAVGAVTLADAGNDFQGEVRLTGRDVHIVDRNGLDLQAVTASGDFTVSSNGVLNLGAGRIDGSLTATSNGHAIGQRGGLTVAGAATIDAGAADIALDAANDFRGAVALTGGAVRVRDINDLDIRALVGGTGGLDLQAGGNLLLPTGDIDTGSADLRLVAGGTLGTPGALHGANVTLHGGTGLDLDHDVTATSGLSLGGGVGAIQQNAGRIAAVRLDVEGGSARLDAAGNAVGALGDVDVAGAFALRNAQAIQQAAGTTVKVGGAASFDAGGQDIVLANAGNDFGGPVSLTGSD
ncbi:filamentous hemagglutinin N-terminal domain-containing protein, partial [Coralloluteibacterium thermophilus]